MPGFRDVLRLDDVNRLLTPWDLRARAHDIARGGVENLSVIADTEEGKRVLRVHRPGTLGRVQMEMAALAQLAARGLPVPAPIATPAGDLTSLDGERPLSLLAHLPGMRLDTVPLTPALARQMGTLLAEVDRALATAVIVADNALAHDITNAAAARDQLAACAEVAGIPWASVARALADAPAFAAGGAQRSLPAQLIHGDVSRTNALVCDGALALIDFGDVGRAPRVADIAIAVAQLSVVGGRFRGDLAEALLAGYTSVAPLEPGEWKALLPLVRLRFARLVVDHVFRELSGRHHPGHVQLVALGLEGLKALASADAAAFSSFVAAAAFEGAA